VVRRRRSIFVRDLGAIFLRDLVVSLHNQCRLPAQQGKRLLEPIPKQTRKGRSPGTVENYRDHMERAACGLSTITRGKATLICLP
jgi:hypothetical protein